jgi:hypothetical protein
MPALSKRITPQNAPDCHGSTFQHAMFCDGFIRIVRAGWRVDTAWRKPWRNGNLVESNKLESKPTHRNVSFRLISVQVIPLPRAKARYFVRVQTWGQESCERGHLARKPAFPGAIVNVYVITRIWYYLGFRESHCWRIETIPFLWYTTHSTIKTNNARKASQRQISCFPSRGLVSAD